MLLQAIALFFSFVIISLFGCSTSHVSSSGTESNRNISSIIEIDRVTPIRANWNFVALNVNLNGLVYTPFFVNGQKLTFYSGGHGAKVKRNNALKLEVDLTSKNPILFQKMIIKEGPSFPYYSYFRAPRVAKNGDELWMLVEVAGCYNGCNDAENPKSLAVYHSLNDGNDWTFLDFAKVDGQRYVSQWNAHTGLIFNPNGSSSLDLKNLGNNRFITIGEKKELMVSADGINYTSVAINHPFPQDRFIFASLVKTPYGYHITSSANWSDSYYTTTVRHLFSKDLVNWYAIESNSFLKNPKFYKGVHLSYDDQTNLLWAVSPCGTADSCSLVASMKARNFLKVNQSEESEKKLSVGEYVHIDGKTAMIVSLKKIDTTILYNVRFSDGTYKGDYTLEMLKLPLKGYQKEGCLDGFWNKICIGDTVYVNKQYGSIIGIKKSLLNTKFSVKFANGEVATDYYSWALSLPNK